MKTCILLFWFIFCSKSNITEMKTTTVLGSKGNLGTEVFVPSWLAVRIFKVINMIQYQLFWGQAIYFSGHFLITTHKPLQWLWLLQASEMCFYFELRVDDINKRVVSLA